MVPKNIAFLIGIIFAGTISNVDSVEMLPASKVLTFWSQDKSVCAISDPLSRVTTVYKVKAKGFPKMKLWAMHGWFREAHVLNDGNHLVVSVLGLDLLHVQSRKETPMIYFFREAKLIEWVSLNELIEDRSKMPLSAAGNTYRWGQYIGLNQQEQFVVDTFEGRRVYDPKTGRALKEVTSLKVKASVEELIKKGMVDFRNNMMSDDEAVRQKAFDSFMPTQNDLKAIFGEDATLIWNVISKPLKAMRSKTSRIREEFKQTGQIKSLELINVRKNDISGRYAQLIKKIPSSIPLYRAIAKYDRGRVGSSTYVVIDGEAKFIHGLESMLKEIKRLKGLESVKSK